MPKTFDEYGQNDYDAAYHQLPEIGYVHQREAVVKYGNEHYLQRRVTRVDFVARPYSAYTISIRLRGYRAALLDYGIVPHPEWVHLGEPEDEQFIQDGLIGSDAHHITCGNDETAAALMPQLEKCGIGIPQDMAVVAFDDIRYASMLKVPLTTFHQPVQQIGDLALEAMLWRLAHPTEPPRTITVAGTMITRQSCGVESG